jgi:erythromycin esterase
MKHRIIKYLAENAGFNIFSIEANMPESYKLNEYIVNRNGDPVDLIKGMYFWTWRTEEVLGMVEWMKKYNEPGKKISFTGFDMQFFSGAIDELDQAYKNQVEIQNLLKELRTGLDEISQERKNSGREVISNEKRNKTVNQIKSLRDYVSGSDKPLSEKSWLLQNIRILEQYLDVSSRDKYMAENLLWIRSQNPGSKIVSWAHNGHIQKTDYRMGMYLSESLKEDYLTIGISFHKGNYTAMGDHGLSAYESQESYPGTYEYFFNMVDEPVFILDLREAKKQNPEQARWLLDPLPFRSVGAVKMVSEFSETDLTEDFDLIIFIRESTSSTLLN